MRNRLSWDEAKVAQIMKQADPYTMNQERHNPPAEKYNVGGPSEFGEDQNKNHPWENEGRTETGHPAPAREAVVQAKKLEDKALKCITIAQRMLPGADESWVEDQATDLMFLPEKAIMATLNRQSELATKIAAESCDDDKKEEVKEEEVEAKAKKDEEEEATASKKEEVKEEEVEAKAKKDEEEEATASKKKDEEEEATASKKKDEEEEATASKKEEVKDEEKEEVLASDKDLLDIIFDGAEVAAAEVAPKTGAKKLSGIVKQASSSSSLDSLWDCPPDISNVFGK